MDNNSSQNDVLDPAPSSETILEFEPEPESESEPEPIIDINPSLDEEIKDNFTQPADTTTNKDLSAEELKTVMDDIENNVNFTSLDESTQALNNPEFLLQRLQNAFNTFKERVGRTMSYSEMRSMMG